MIIKNLVVNNTFTDIEYNFLCIDFSLYIYNTINIQYVFTKF